MSALEIVERAFEEYNRRQQDKKAITLEDLLNIIFE